MLLNDTFVWVYENQASAHVKIWLIMTSTKRSNFGHLLRREDSLEKTLMLGKIEGTRRRGRQRMRWLDSVLEATGVSLAKLREAVKDRRAWRALVYGVTKSRTRLND